jgi:hypothetical protein
MILKINLIPFARFNLDLFFKNEEQSNIAMGICESMIGGSKVMSQMVVFHTITNKVFNVTMI